MCNDNPHLCRGEESGFHEKAQPYIALAALAAPRPKQAPQLFLGGQCPQAGASSAALPLYHVNSSLDFHLFNSLSLLLLAHSCTYLLTRLAIEETVASLRF